MKIFVVGNGKLANAILSADLSFSDCEMSKWDASSHNWNDRSIVVHAGSGRQLDECLEFCNRTDSVFIELSTGLYTENFDPGFTLIVCPNTSILLLKTLNIFRQFGSLFENNKISITESHQSTKKSVAGTAFSIAHSLKYPTDKIHSIRDAEVQLTQIGIPGEFLDKHAYHKIVIEDGSDMVTIETKVLGHNSYAQGVKKIIQVVLEKPLEKRKYSILELIDNKML